MNQDLQELQLCLQESAILLTDFCLYHGAKWSAEALNSIVLDQPQTDSSINHNNNNKHFRNRFRYSENSKSESNVFLLAKTYFNTKEFDRCAFVLKSCTSPESIFLKLYATYLSGEKKREEESEGVLGQNDTQSTNDAIPQILKELAVIMEFNEYSNNPFLNYLYGIILLKQKSIESAIEYLVKSIMLYPFNWSCWKELILNLSNYDEAMLIISKLLNYFKDDFPSLIILNFANIVTNQEFFKQEPELYSELDELLKIFPTFSFLKTQKALISYHALEYNEAEELFDEILQSDPFRLDDMDIYSNILYVMEKKSKLAFLSQFSTSIDKFRPETCCIIANYYSLKFQHEKAIMYYRRALTLNRNCLSAWTLMGHEFVELKNSHAAIESYRRAVDSNSKDFKAWYGLGQAYEVLDMHLYSMYYYQKACSLKPMDKRIWQALGNCYQKLDKLNESIKSYLKALKLSEFNDLVILFKLAKLYELTNDNTKVYEFMKLCYLEEVNNGIKNDETAKARLWLAQYELKLKNFEEAYKYAVDLNHGTASEIEEARNIARISRGKARGRV